MEKQGWEYLCITFIILLIISIAINLVTRSENKSLEDSRASLNQYYIDNFESKCPKEMPKKICIEQDQEARQYYPAVEHAVICKHGEYGVCVDEKLESYSLCNKLDNLHPACLKAGAIPIICPKGSRIGCYDIPTGKLIDSSLVDIG